jgi:hypothetical protein
MLGNNKPSQGHIKFEGEYGDVFCIHI